MAVHAHQYFEVELSNVKPVRKWIFFQPTIHQVFSFFSSRSDKNSIAKVAMSRTKLACSRLSILPLSGGN